jgi:nitric oxide dioxygenase
MLSPRTIEVVKATAPLVAEHAEVITRRFYGLMFAGNPEVLAYFNPAHQHSGGQQRALAGAICAYAANIDDLSVLGLAIELIAQKHCSLGIQAAHYPIVGKHLLGAITEVLGEAATEEVLSAWEEAYGVLAKTFIDREGEIYELQSSTPGGWNGYRSFRVRCKLRENDHIASLYLTPVDDGPLPRYQAGQYITVNVEHPRLPASLRNYSLSDRPGTGYFRISVKRETGPGADSPAGIVSHVLHDGVQEGDVSQIGPPCGDFTLDTTALSSRRIVLIAGGIGVTPMMAMLKELAYRRWSSPVYFIHAVRNSGWRVFEEEIREATVGRPNFHFHARFDAPLADDVARGRCDSVGVVDLPFLQELLPDNDAEFYFCGPQPMMAAVHRALKEWEVPDARLHFEFFGPKQDLERKSASLEASSRTAVEAAHA